MESYYMRKHFLMCGVLALGVAGLLPCAGIAADKANDIPGPIDSIKDLQDTGKMLFKLADTNNDGQISQKEATDVGNLLVGGFFFRADQNGDGTLTPEEARQARDALFIQQPLFRYMLTKAKPPNQPQQDATTNQAGQAAQNVAANPIQTIGNLLDGNHDRKLEASELRQTVQMGVQTLFTMADANQDGQLSPAELNRVVNEAARSAVQAAFQAADSDRNGALSIAEFDKALTEPAHAAFRILDANGDNQISLDELQRAQQVITDQLKRLRVPDTANANSRQTQAGGTPTGTFPTNSSGTGSQIGGTPTSPP